MKRCQNCHKEPRGQMVRGLCPACRRFEYRTGRSRQPEDMIRDRTKRRPWCKRCKQSLVCNRRGGLCSACFQYEKDHGRPRPAYFWRETCLNCGRTRNGTRFARGRCYTCYMYRRKYGRDRSKELIRAHAPHGWCDCGRRAVAVVTAGVRISAHGNREFEMALCAECLAVETDFNTISI